MIFIFNGGPLSIRVTVSSGRCSVSDSSSLWRVDHDPGLANASEVRGSRVSGGRELGYGHCQGQSALVRRRPRPEKDQRKCLGACQQSGQGDPAAVRADGAAAGGEEQGVTIQPAGIRCEAAQSFEERLGHITPS